MNPIICYETCMNERRELARKLRLNGQSYGEILTQIEASKSSISKWCNDICLPESVQKRLRGRGGKASGRGIFNKLARQNEIMGIKSQSKLLAPTLSYTEFKLAGLMLYWAEGAKSRLVDFTNSDPAMITLMVRWFREVCKVNDKDFRVQLHLHVGQDESNLKTYWSKLTNIPLHQFHKTYIKRPGTGHRKNRLYRGTAKIRICNKNLLHRILGMIDGVECQARAVSSAGRADDSI